MSALDDARDRFVADFEALRPTLREPTWLEARRAEAIEAFAAAGLPSTRLEEWRYTNVTRLAKHAFEPAPERTLTREDLESLATPLFACSLFAFANGRFQPDLSSLPGLPGGAHCDSLAAVVADDPGALESHLGDGVDLKRHPFAALNTANVVDGAVLRIPRGDAVEQPVHLVFAAIGGERPAVAHPRVVVVAEPDSQVTIVQDHVSLGDAPGFTNAVTEIYLGANAQVHWISLQREHDGQFHLGNLQVRQARDSRFTAHTLTLGGALVRNDAEVLLAEEGAECRLDGLFVAGGDGLVDNHTLVDHAVPHCTSHELYKGVLGGKAKGVFRGRVIVRPDAQKTYATQSNPNLLIGRRAEVNTKPQLEIYADDVKCSHGSTIGQLDEDALFYLRARAIDVEVARDMLTRAFALEVLEGLPGQALTEGLDDAVLGALRRARGVHREDAA